MTPVTPNREVLGLPPDSREVVYAKDQPEYIPLPAAVTPDGRVVTQWQLTEAEREQVAAGDPITLVLHTFNLPLQPIQLAVGGMDLR